MSAGHQLTSRFEEALFYASQVHGGQKREGTPNPDRAVSWPDMALGVGPAHLRARTVGIGYLVAGLPASKRAFRDRVAGARVVGGM